jgi:toxin ParE1/3/4
MREVLFLELSDAADLDLVDIYAYTTAKFGQQQATEYLLGIDELFTLLTSDPMIGRERKEIRAELRSVLFVAHIVLYRILPDRIRIARVLHASRDLPKHI